MHVLTVLEARKSGSVCQQVCSLLRPLPWLAGGRLLAGSSHSLSSVHTVPQCLSLCPDFLSSSQIRLGLTLWLPINHLLKGRVSKSSQILRFQVRALTCKLWEHTIQPRNEKNVEMVRKSRMGEKFLRKLQKTI